MKRIIAREWLIFLSCLLAGFGIVVSTIVLFFDATYAQFWSALSMQEGRLYFWKAAFALLSPYFLVQLVRSIVWAIAARNKSN